MSEDDPKQPEPPNQPGWGAPYPPPGQSTPPPGYGYPPAGYGYPAGGYGYGPVPPKHPNATTAMVLGIVGVAGGLLCYLPLFASPFALFLGRKTIKEIDASKGQLDGRSEAKAGFVLGIIGTVMLAIGLALVALFIVLSLTIDGFWDDDDSDPDNTFDTTMHSSLVAPGTPVG